MHAGTGEEHAAEMCARMPLPVIGGFTQDEGIALGAMLSSGRGNTFLNLNESIHGFLLDNGMLRPAVSAVLCFVKNVPSGVRGFHVIAAGHRLEH